MLPNLYPAQGNSYLERERGGGESERERERKRERKRERDKKWKIAQFCIENNHIATKNWKEKYF